MKLSKNIWLASCLSVVFLASAASCIVEDRNLEENGVFRCKNDSDCLSGSVCVKASQDPEAEGSCTPEKEVNRCHDYDGDGFYAADEGYDEQCGFGENNPKDLDDNNPMVNPNADEVCDGLDNNQDGCVDGTCAELGACTGEDKSRCLRLFRPCAGVVSLEESLYIKTKDDDGEPHTKLSVCNPVQFGGMFCVAKKDDDGKVTGGEFKFGFYNPDGLKDYASEGDVVYHSEQTTCQDPDSIKYDLDAPFQTSNGANETKYLEFEGEDESVDGGKDESPLSEYFNNMVDEDCDGLDHKVVVEECKEPTETVVCFVNSSGVYNFSTGLIETEYENVIARCKTALGEAFADASKEEIIAKCGCIGARGCVEGNPNLVCKTEGVVIDVDKVGEYSKDDPLSGQKVWNCLD